MDRRGILKSLKKAVTVCCTGQNDGIVGAPYIETPTPSGTSMSSSHRQGTSSFSSSGPTRWGPLVDSPGASFSGSFSSHFHSPASTPPRPLRIGSPSSPAKQGLGKPSYQGKGKKVITASSSSSSSGRLPSFRGDQEAGPSGSNHHRREHIQTHPAFVLGQLLLTAAFVLLTGSILDKRNNFALQHVLERGLTRNALRKVKSVAGRCCSSGDHQSVHSPESNRPSNPSVHPSSPSPPSASTIPNTAGHQANIQDSPRSSHAYASSPASSNPPSWTPSLASKSAKTSSFSSSGTTRWWPFLDSSSRSHTRTPSPRFSSPDRPLRIGSPASSSDEHPPGKGKAVRTKASDSSTSSDGVPFWEAESSGTKHHRELPRAFCEIQMGD